MKINRRQLEAFIDVLKCNQISLWNSSNNLSPSQRNVWNIEWIKLTDLLNSFGVMECTTEDWQQFWKQYKCQLKMKSLAQKHLSRNNIKCQSEISKLEEKLLNIIEFPPDTESCTDLDDAHIEENIVNSYKLALSDQATTESGTDDDDDQIAEALSALARSQRNMMDSQKLLLETLRNIKRDLELNIVNLNVQRHNGT